MYWMVTAMKAITTSAAASMTARHVPGLVKNADELAASIKAAAMLSPCVKKSDSSSLMPQGTSP
jgi:hypothetical protein